MNRPAFIKPLLLLTIAIVLGIAAYVSFYNPDDISSPAKQQLDENTAAIETLLQAGDEGNTTVFCRTLQRRFDAAKESFSAMMPELNALSARNIDSNLREMNIKIEEACS